MKITVFAFSLIIFSSLGQLAIGQKKVAAGPHLLVYKTKKDYRNNVSVILTDDKSQVASYPDPKDISTGHTVPSALHGGYLLDNRGIGARSAMLKMTNKEYANLKKAPSADELYKMIIDKDPLTILYDCGNRYGYKDPVGDVNKLIDEKKLTTKCKAIKKQSSKK